MTLDLITLSANAGPLTLLAVGLPILAAFVGLGGVGCLVRGLTKLVR